MRAERSKLQKRLENGEGVLREDKSVYRMSSVICGSCGRKHPGDTKKCHSCNPQELFEEYCSPETRAGTYFNALRHAALWPFTECLHNTSIRDISSRPTRILKDPRHDCTAKLSCPLKVQYQGLLDDLKKIADGVSGLCLQCLKHEEIKTLTKSHRCPQVPMVEKTNGPEE